DERERLDRIIRRRALAFSMCAVDHAQVDRLGHIKARHLATAGAVAGLKIPAEYLLVDAWDVPEAPLPQMAVVRGDRTCASIMAASIGAHGAPRGVYHGCEHRGQGGPRCSHGRIRPPLPRLRVRRPQGLRHSGTSRGHPPPPPKPDPPDDMGALSRNRPSRVELGKAGEKAAADLLRKRGYEAVGAGF